MAEGWEAQRVLYTGYALMGNGVSDGGANVIVLLLWVVDAGDQATGVERQWWHRCGHWMLLQDTVSTAWVLAGGSYDEHSDFSTPPVWPLLLFISTASPAAPSPESLWHKLQPETGAGGCWAILEGLLHTHPRDFVSIQFGKCSPFCLKALQWLLFPVRTLMEKITY
jgi:hypothetical protein